MRAMSLTVRGPAPLLLLLPLAFAAGCGGNVVVDDPATTSATGAGGSTGTGTTTATTTSIAACPGAVVEIAVDSGSAHGLPSICAATIWNPTQSSGPVAYVVMGPDPSSVHAIEIDACAGPGGGAEGIRSWMKGLMGPGTYTTGDLRYTDPTGATWQTSGTYTLDIAQLGAVGDFIDGDVNGVVVGMDGVSKHQITGKFHVCRVPDQLFP